MLARLTKLVLATAVATWALPAGAGPALLFEAADGRVLYAEDADNQYEGRMTARQALVKSKNGATVRIGMDAGIEAVLQLCSSAGIRSSLRPYPATFLGSSEVTLAELAMGYTIFPNGGWRPSTPHILERIEEKTEHWCGMGSSKASGRS